MKSLLKHALAYQRRGWSVIPIDRRSKMPPAGFEWREYQDRIPTEEELREWWTIWPLANIGIVTGKASDLVVVDFDPRKGGDPTNFFAEHPTEYVVKTGGGGYHLYYSHPGYRVPNQVDEALGRDVRADGGYVIAPPSRHPSGGVYAWAAQNGGGRPAVAPPVVAPLPGATEEGHTPASEPWLSKVLGGVAEGSRNDAAARLAGYYLKKKIPPDVVVNMMNTWDEKNSPPLGPAVIQRTVDSVNKTARRRNEFRPPPRDSLIAEPIESFGLVGFSDYMATYGDVPVEWMVEDWMPHKTIAMAVAPPGTYKTWLELALAISVSSGMPFLGRYKINKPGPVIIVQQEDFHGQMAERLAVITGSMFEFGASSKGDNFSITPPPKLPIYLHPDRRLRFADNIAVEGLEQKIAHIRPALVIIDPLYSTGQTDDFMVSLVNDLWPLKDMRDKYGTSFFLAHHTGKRAEGTGREDAWGSQFLNAFIETGWQIRRKDEPNTAVIRRHFKVRQDIEEQVIKFDISTDRPAKFNVELRDAGTKEEEGVDILALLDELGPMTQSDLARKVGKSKATLSRKMRNLEAAELVFKDVGGKYHTREEML